MPGLVTKVTDTIGAAGVMFRAGLVPFPRLDRGLKSIAAVDKYGPFAGPVHAHAENGYDAVAIIDERGPITYAELERQSNALVRAWQADGITSDSVMGAMCRNHRGLVLTMLAAAKNGTKLVLMNTGFARPQLVDVAAREKVVAFVYDDEFAAIADALPDDVVVYRSWPEGTAADGSTAATLDEAIAGRTTSSVPAPEKNGGFVLLTSGTTGTPKGAPRGHTSPLASAQFLDRVPLRRGQTMMMAAPAFHGTGVSQFALALALGQTVVMHRKFDPENTIKLVAQYKCDSLVVVPTMLTRIIDLGPDVLSKYDTSNLKIIFSAGSSLSPDLCKRVTASFGYVLYNLYGSTEVAVATVATPEDLTIAPGTAGRAPVTCYVELFDENNKKITTPTHDRQDLRRQRAELRGIHRRARQGTYRRTSFDRRRRTLRRQRPPLRRRPRRRHDRLRWRERLPARSREPARRSRGRLGSGSHRSRGRRLRAPPASFCRRRPRRRPELRRAEGSRPVESRALQGSPRDRLHRRTSPQRHRKAVAPRPDRDGDQRRLSTVTKR